MEPHDPALLNVLKTAPFSPECKAKLPRRQLSRTTLTLLILLRIYVVLAIPVVAYAFIHALS